MSFVIPVPARMGFPFIRGQVDCRDLFLSSKDWTPGSDFFAYPMRMDDFRDCLFKMGYWVGQEGFRGFLWYAHTTETLAWSYRIRESWNDQLQRFHSNDPWFVGLCRKFYLSKVGRMK